MSTKELNNAEFNMEMLKKENLCPNMVKFRAKFDLDMGAAARLANVSRQTWHNVESGRQKPTRVTAIKILTALSMEHDEITEKLSEVDFWL